VHYDRRDGYGKNIVTGTDIDDRNEVGARASLLWKPVDGLDILTIADYSREDDRANGLHYFGPAQPGVCAPGSRLGRYRAAQQPRHRERHRSQSRDYDLGHRRTGQLQHRLGKVQVDHAFRKVDSVNLTDVDGTSVQIAFDRLFDKATSSARN